MSKLRSPYNWAEKKPDKPNRLQRRKVRLRQPGMAGVLSRMRESYVLPLLIGLLIGVLAFAGMTLFNV